MHIKNTIKALLAGALLASWGCSAPQPPASSGAAKTGTDGTTDGTNGASSDGNQNNGNNTDNSSAADFSGWCRAASQTQVVQNNLNQYFGQLCDNGGNPTSLFTGYLVNSAYNGQGDPQIKYVQKISSDSSANTTTAYFAVGIELPISIKQHFDNIAPLEGTQQAASELAAAQGATQGPIDIQPHNPNDRYHVRGWQIHSTTTDNSAGIPLTTETVADDDQYMFKDGSLYMYTTVTTQGIQTIKQFNLLTAGMEINNQGYLLTIAYLVVDNHGLADLAAQKIKTTAIGLIKSMRQAAQNGGGGSGQ
jgi:hypothetical protein